MTSSTPCGTVLIVEDDPSVREALSVIVGDEGYAVAEAADGQQALDYLHRHDRPCLVILDLMMPVMDGWQLLAAMKGEPDLRGIAVVIVSAAARERLDDALRLGAADCLRKPVHVDAVLEVVERFC